MFIVGRDQGFLRCLKLHEIFYITFMFDIKFIILIIVNIKLKVNYDVIANHQHLSTRVNIKESINSNFKLLDSSIHFDH